MHAHVVRGEKGYCCHLDNARGSHILLYLTEPLHARDLAPPFVGRPGGGRVRGIWADGLFCDNDHSWDESQRSEMK